MKFLELNILEENRHNQIFHNSPTLSMFLYFQNHILIKTIVKYAKPEIWPLRILKSGPLRRYNHIMYYGFQKSAISRTYIHQKVQ